MKQADNTATLASYKSPSEMGMKRQSERTTGTVLSEVTLNIGSAQDYGNFSVRKSNVQDIGDTMERGNVISSRSEKPDELENLSEVRGKSQVEVRETHADRSNSRNVTPIQEERTSMKEYCRDESRDLSGEAKKAVDVNRSLSKIGRKRIFETDGKFA
ncbi:hypothetical protein LOAG_07221 [Loa loa]|uniref:Uncharacterized protein n=1 Tax=Loa loa TaxID=7209 RepID=A0A1S0TW95_LOALO|nr:hypothetical protein LOAG_07221 [Loa loa]EFO21264.1 hypothetical protein LOAG_07221 [Loa loa]